MTTVQTEATQEKKRPPRFLLAMPEDVRLAIERAAFTNGRTVTAEINLRLKASLDNKPPATQTSGPASYSAPNTPTVLHPANDKGPASTLSGTDQAMLEVFRGLPPEKQLALLSLFK
ncbi:MAG: Arc family DNA-binding protein [Gammaproteobacteria bacterium]|nr:Arc family DNA-binding protein [Gammaproteobacteria bacterium]